MGRGAIPSGCVALEIFALALKKSSPDLLAGIVVPPRILDLLRRPHWQLGVHELRVSLDKADPFIVLGHRDRPCSQLINSVVSRVGFSLEDASVGIVGLLDLAYNNRFQLPTGRFEVQICLRNVGFATLSS